MSILLPSAGVACRTLLRIVGIPTIAIAFSSGPDADGSRIDTLPGCGGRKPTRPAPSATTDVAVVPLTALGA